MEPNLEQAVNAFKSGQTALARQLLVKIVKDHPQNAQAWYVLSFAVDNQNQQIDCLKRVLKFTPENQAARNRLEMLMSQTSSHYKPIEQTHTSSIVEANKSFNDFSKLSLSNLFQEWFQVLSYREQKVVEYLYLDANQFSTSAVGRIIGENPQKVLEIKKKALGKLCQPDAFAIAKPLFDWHRLRTKGNSEASAASNIVGMFSRDWEIGNILPVGVSRLLADIQDERKSIIPINNRNSKPIVDKPPKTQQIAMQGRPIQLPVETRFVDSEQNHATVVQNNHICKILQSDPSPLTELGLSRRVYNALFRSGIQTIGQLAALPETRLWRAKNIGEAAVKEIQSRVREYEAKLSVPGILTEKADENTLETSSEKIWIGQLNDEKIQPSQKNTEPRHINHELATKTERTSQAIDENMRIVPPFDLGEKPISVLGLSVRSYNVLMRSNVKTLQSLVALSDEELLGLRNAGRKTVNEIRAKLADFLADNKIERQEFEAPIALQISPLPKDQTFEEREAGKENNSFRYWFISFSETGVFVSKPIDEISIERLGLSERIEERLLQKGIRTISDLLSHEEKIILDSELGKSLKDYLEWLAEQDESVWLDETKGKSLMPLSKLRLTNTTCEISIVEWLELLSDEREKRILMWRYGINSPTLTLQEIGEKLNITRERIRQIEKRGLQRLRNSYGRQGQQLLKPITDYLKFVFKEHDGLINESEMRAGFHNDGLVTVGDVDLIGFLALLCEIDDRFQYFRKNHLFAIAGYSVTTIASVQETISKMLREKLTPMYREELLYELKHGGQWRDDQEQVDEKFLFACLRTHPKVEELESGAYVYANASNKRLGAIVRALRDIGGPAHYSVITEKTNSFLNPDEQFTERAVHAKLGQHPDIFVWIRLRGTYGLKEWGLEQGLSYVDAIEQIFLEEGKPLTFEQVLERMPTHREHFDEGSVIITLGTHEKFKSLANNTYGLSSWKNNMPSLDFGNMFGEQLAQRQTELDRHNNRSEIDTQSEVDKIRRIGLDFLAP